MAWAPAAKRASPRRSRSSARSSTSRWRSAATPISGKWIAASCCPAPFPPRSDSPEARMKFPLLATTLAGSLPKPSWLAEPEKLWAPWKLEGAALEEAKRDAVRLVVAMEEKAGIDILSDGEQTRRHFVNGYMEKLEGIDFANLKTVRIRNRYDANVPRAVGPVSRPRPVHSEDAKFFRSLSDRALKFTLPGPMTMVDTLYDEHYGSREKLAMAFAEILNQEALELCA